MNVYTAPRPQRDCGWLCMHKKPITIDDCGRGLALPCRSSFLFGEPDVDTSLSAYRACLCCLSVRPKQQILVSRFVLG